MLADRVSLPAVNDATEELREQEETHAREALLDVLSNSIAFHNSDLSPEERPLGAQLRMADRSGARYAVVVGEREAERGTLVLRRMADGEQAEVEADQAAQHIRGGGGAR